MVLNGLTLSGDVERMHLYSNWVVKGEQRSCDLVPYNTELGREIAHAVRDCDESVKQHLVCNENGFLQGESSKAALKKAGYVLRDKHIIPAPKGFIGKIFG